MDGTRPQGPDAAGSGRREDVLAVLRASTVPLGIAAIAGRLDLHPNTVRFHLETLVERGQAERVTPARAGRGRPPLAFRAHRGMDPAGPRNYRTLAAILATGLAGLADPARRAVEAGQVWGRQVAAGADRRPGRRRTLTWLLGLLDDLGFAPEAQPVDSRARDRVDPTSTGPVANKIASKELRAGDTIALRHCPFLDLVDGRSSVICSAHLGLMQGALAYFDSPVTVTGLEPFARPDQCLARLGPAPAPLPGGASPA